MRKLILDRNMSIPNQSLRERLADNLKNVAAWADKRKKKELVQLMADLVEKLNEERFNLVVLGEFKRGKSTFLNAILGESILPTAVVPLTSVITHVIYGKTLRIEVRFQNGSRQEILPAELPGYITEKENPENRKKVDEVWVAYPATLLKEGVHLIDTPGVGSVYQHNTDLALRFLPQVDGVIFILSADPPISRSEINFLKEIRQYAAKMFFLQNKIDLLEETDREESFRFTHKTLSDLLDGVPIRLYPISARWALSGKMEKDTEKISKSLLPEVERALESFLGHEKEAVLLLSVVQTLLRILHQEQFSLSLQQAILNAPLGALPERQAAFIRQKESILAKRTDAHHLLKGEARILLSVIEEEIARFTAELSPRLDGSFLSDAGRISGGGRKLRDRMVHQLQGNLQAAFDAWRPLLEKKVSEEVARMIRSFADRLNGVADQLIRLSAGLFGITFKPLEATEGLTLENGFYYYDVRLYEASFITPLVNGMVDLLPSRLSRLLILADLRQMLAEQITRHAGRLRADLQERLEAEIQRFRFSLDRWVDDTVAQIEEAMALALQKKGEGEASLVKSLQENQEEINFLEQIAQNLQSIRQEVPFMASHLDK